MISPFSKVDQYLKLFKKYTGENEILHIQLHELWYGMSDEEVKLVEAKLLEVKVREVYSS